MPDPRYIICAEDAIVDNVTNLVTLIKVMDRVRITLRPGPPQEPEPSQRRWLNVRAFATWSRSEEEPHDQVFDYELAVRRPGHEEQIAINGQFSFEGGDDKRFDLTLQGYVFTQPGVFEVISRVRPVGQEDWLSQAYKIPVTVVAELGGDEE